MDYKQAMSSVITKAARVARLEKFFQQVFEMSNQPPTTNILNTATDEVCNLELTKTEFAEALGMSPTSSFVENV